MKSEGFQPCLVVQTSPNNNQAWLDHGRKLPKELSTAAARALAERFGGDLRSADWRHFGRLSGLTNRKEKQRQPNNLFPYVRIIEAAPRLIYDQAGQFLQGVERSLEKSVLAAAKAAAKSRVLLRGKVRSTAAVKSIADFHVDPRYAGDLSRVDLAYTVYALGHGVSEDSIRGALTSRSLTKKGGEARIEDYIKPTFLKAAEQINRKPSNLRVSNRVRELSR